jgi:hypothetical protein
MSEPARNRFALDLDDLERQLRGAAQPQKPGSASDPLMELTRLVGQDDPLKELFAGRSASPRPVVPALAQPAASWPPARIEPSFQPEAAPQPAPAQPVAPPAELRGALDEFEALLRRTEPARPAPARAPVAMPEPAYDEPAVTAQPQPYAMQAEGQHAYVPEEPRDLDEAAATGHPSGYEHQQAPDYGEPPLADEEVHQFERPRSRKGVLTAAALIAVAVVGVGTATVFRNKTPAGVNGQPPVISADTGPTKVAPTNPGGAEIPNQNKQIYERAADSPAAGSADKTKVVSREEQPVDVQQATRSLSPRPSQSASGSITPTETAGASLAPTEPGLIPIPAVPGLGEPRRVRTVAIRPDGTPAPSNGSNGNGAAQGLVTGSAPPAARPAAAPTQAVVRPQPTMPASEPTMPASEPAKPQEPRTQERAAAAPTTPPASQTPPARTRTAALGTQPAATPAQTPAAATTAPRPDASGGFAVQLGAPGSEAEARATFSALQRKYPEQLGGQSPIVRKTELNGKTVYRLRVGPYSREDATSMCSALQAAGGQCFIAKN